MMTDNRQISVALPPSKGTFGQKISNDQQNFYHD